MTPELWGFKRIESGAYPVREVAVTHATKPIYFDVKKAIQKETLARMIFRVVGNITIAGVGAGAATGRENPEALLLSMIAKTSPALGVSRLNNLSARGSILMGIFERGYAIRHADVADAAGVSAVDIMLPYYFKQPGSVNPIEWGLPLSLFENFNLQLTVGGRDQLFTGGTNTWDLSALRYEIWADFDSGVAGLFHIVEELEQTFPITATQTDFKITLEKGFIYTHLMLSAERDNALVDNIINNVAVRSAGRDWLQAADGNYLPIQRWNRETHVNNAAEALTGVIFLPALRDGMYKRGIDCLDATGEIILDVTLGAGTVRQVNLRAKRIVPLGLNVGAVKAA